MSEHTTIERELSERGLGIFQTVGDSMEPLLHDRSTSVVIAKKEGRLRPYDVALYHRPGGAYVLHRVVKVLEGAYIIRGDNRIYNETVPEDWIIGVMTGFYMGNRLISCEDQSYKGYMKGLKPRYIVMKLSDICKKIAKKLFTN